MKLMHLADLHIGKIVAGYSMLEDQKYILSQIINIADEKAVDAVMIAGDLYDRSQPPEKAVELVDRFLTELRRRGKEVYIISGNHDSAERVAFGSSIFEESGVYIAKDYKVIDKTDEYGPIHIWMLPFYKQAEIQNMFPDAEIGSYTDAFRVLLDSREINTDERNVILLHQYVTAEGEKLELSGSENLVTGCIDDKAMDDMLGTIEKLPASLFDRFDYVAMGHVHRPQRVGRDTCRYAGSLLSYAVTDVRGTAPAVKTVPIVDVGESDTSVELVELKPLRCVRRVRGKLEDIITGAIGAEDESEKKALEDYVYVTLTDEDMTDSAYARLREQYPRIMGMEYDNSRTSGEMNTDAVIENVANLSIEELVREYFNYSGKGEPTEKQLKVIMDIAKEVGLTE